ncbi:MAG: flagellar basal body protein FliL [Desulfobacteraceae bacterium]|nr:flagellar basal body protein FliL [Desulfobacteraceae bacterium]
MSKTVVIIIAAVAVLFIGMMGAGFFILWSKVSNVSAVQQPVAQEAPEDETNTLGPLYPMETLIVNLADKGGKRYLRTTMQFELSDMVVREEIENRLPQIKDSFLMVLPTKTYDQVYTTEGKTALRDELMAKLNEFLTKGEVKNIYFTEFVVQ